jgi:chaperonin GroEL (HSP60 family)
MTTKLATVDKCFLVGAEEAVVNRNGSISPRNDRDKPQVDALQFACGYLSPYFITDPERMEVTFEDVYILIHEKIISSKNDLVPLLDQITNSGKPLLIIAEDIGGEVLATLVVKKLRGPLQVAAVRAPGSGDERKDKLRDIALLTGGKVITEGLATQLNNLWYSDLGRAKKITINMNSTMIEGRATSSQFSFDPGPDIRANAQPVQSSWINITPGARGILSA